MGRIISVMEEGSNFGKFFTYLVGRGLLSVLFYEDPLPTPMLPTRPFSNFCQPSPPSRTCLSPPTPTVIVFSVVLFLWLNGWSHHINMDLHISSLGTLLPEGPWCVSYARRHQVYWGLKQCGFSLVLGFDITRKTYTAQSGASRLTHPYKFLFKWPVICSQQLPLLH